MKRFAAVMIGGLVVAAPAHADPGDLDRRFGDGGRVELSGAGVVTGLALPDGRRPLVTVQPVAGDERRGSPLTVSLSTSGRVLERAPAGTTLPPVGFSVVGSGVDGSGRTVVLGFEPGGRDLAARFLPGGALDTSYGSGGYVDLEAIDSLVGGVVKADGRVHVFGDTSQMVLDAGGRSLLDRAGASFPWPRPNRPGIVDTVADGPGDTVIVAGRDFEEAPFVARIGPDGRPDRTFATRGFVVAARPWFIPAAIVRDRRGRLLVGGTTNAQALVLRLSTKGRVDRAFGRDGRARIAPPRPLRGWNADHLALDERERIVVAGSGWTKDQDVGAFRPVVARLTAR